MAIFFVSQQQQLGRNHDPTSAELFVFKQVVLVHSLQLSLPVPRGQCQGAARVGLPPRSPLPRQGEQFLVRASSLTSKQIWGTDSTCWWSSGHQRSRRLGHLHHRARAELHESSSSGQCVGVYGQAVQSIRAFLCTQLWEAEYGAPPEWGDVWRTGKCAIKVDFLFF